MRDLSLTDKIQFARQIVSALNDNASFPTPVPPLTSVTSAIGAMETAFNEAQTARQTAQTKTSAQNDKSDELDLLLTQLANHIENSSNGDPVKIQSAGLTVRSAAARIGALSVPTDLTATEGDMEGEIDLSWNRVRGAKSYVIPSTLSMTDTPTWASAGVATQSSFTTTGLASGKRHWFRVAAVGAAGQGPWSDPATKIAP